jgi:hypothetical protein
MDEEGHPPLLNVKADAGHKLYPLSRHVLERRPGLAFFKKNPAGGDASLA